MTEDRLMVAEAVFNGQISEDHLTQDEIDEFFEMVCDAATESILADAVARGLNVFEGIEGDTLQ
jgi:uncharacterized protein (UPF0264 family)